MKNYFNKKTLGLTKNKKTNKSVHIPQDKISSVSDIKNNILPKTFDSVFSSVYTLEKVFSTQLNLKKAISYRNISANKDKIKAFSNQKKQFLHQKSINTMDNTMLHFTNSLNSIGKNSSRKTENLNITKHKKVLSNNLINPIFDSQFQNINKLNQLQKDGYSDGKTFGISSIISAIKNKKFEDGQKVDYKKSNDFDVTTNQRFIDSGYFGDESKSITGSIRTIFEDVNESSNLSLQETYYYIEKMLSDEFKQSARRWLVFG